jgi:hypothetical protein
MPENNISEEIDSYLESIRNLDLVVLKLNTNEEVVGVYQGIDDNFLKLFMPIKLLPSYYTIERWRPRDTDEQEIEEDDFDDDDSIMIEDDGMIATAAQKDMFDLFNEPQLHPPVFGQDDYKFQEQQHGILFSQANSKRVISFYHMIDWFQHTDDTIIEINKSSIVSRAAASNDLKHEYMSYLREKTKKEEFEAEQNIPKPETLEEPHFGTIDLSESQFSPYQSRFIH